MKVLFALYNAAAEGKTRYAVFMDILRYARAASIPEVVLPSMKRVEAWAKEWDLGAEESRALFLECSNFMRDYKPSSRSSFDFLLSYLSTFEVNPCHVAARLRADRSALPRPGYEMHGRRWDWGAYGPCLLVSITGVLCPPIYG
mmetsp:Transcript_32912/g.104774  ORF Transcript_32912/g.104774 Transcript_32912/m.104774 type:complete len:144 (-) Transcript_32912:253-684(-)